MNIAQMIVTIMLNLFISSGIVTEQTWGGVNDNYYQKDPPPFSPGVSPHLLGSPCLPPEERHLSMPEIGEKERNYLFKSYTDLE